MPSSRAPKVFSSLRRYQELSTLPAVTSAARCSAPGAMANRLARSTRHQSSKVIPQRLVNSERNIHALADSLHDVADPERDAASTVKIATVASSHTIRAVHGTERKTDMTLLPPGRSSLNPALHAPDVKKAPRIRRTPKPPDRNFARIVSTWGAVVLRDGGGWVIMDGAKGWRR